MGYFSQFQNFNPVNGPIPLQPFPSLQDIASRARRILRSRTEFQIVSAAKTIDSIIGEYRASLYAEEQMLASQSYQEMGLDEDSTSDVIIETSLINSIINLYNRSDLDLFKESNDLLGDWFYDTEFLDHKLHELYAVLALWFVGSTIELLDYESQLRLQLKLQNQLEISEVSIEEMDILLNKIKCISSAGESALLAMDAIGYAERLNKIKTIKTKQATDKNKAIVDASRERSENARRLNGIRHRKNHEAKTKVLTEWEKNPSKFASASKAGIYLAHWIYKDDANCVYEPRTVTDWIRAHAKSRGIVLR